MEVLLKFANPNMSVAKILLTHFEEGDIDIDLENKLTARVNFISTFLCYLYFNHYSKF